MFGLCTQICAPDRLLLVKLATVRVLIKGILYHETAWNIHLSVMRKFQFVKKVLSWFTVCLRVRGDEQMTSSQLLFLPADWLESKACLAPPLVLLYLASDPPGL